MVGDYNIRAPWKRSACDRCRSQKLRCYQDEGGPPGTCHRCIKAGAKCVTSMSRPTGRPPSRQPTANDPNDASTSSESNGTSAGDAGPSRAEENITNLDFDFSIDSMLDSIGIQQPDLTMTNDLDDINDMHDIYFFSQQPKNLHDVPPIAEITHHSRGDSDSSSQSTGPKYQSNNGLLMPRPGVMDLSLAAYNVDRVEILLSQLHLELCNQLLYVRSSPWDVQETLRITMSPESSGGSQDKEIAKEHPLVPVAKALRTLERLLVSLRPSTGPAEHTSLAMSYYSAPPALRTTQILVALSCYIQIVSIYDSIFTTVIEYLDSGGSPISLSPIATSPHQSPSPTLYLGGLPILPDWKLCGTLLMHQIESQLERIEVLIGLPEPYRISSKPGDEGKDAGNGLFAGQQSQSLLNAIFQLGEVRPGEYDMRCVRSLKSKMRQMRDL